MVTFLHAHTAINTHINTHRLQIMPTDHPASAPWPPPLTSLRGAIAEKNYTIHFLLSLPSSSAFSPSLPGSSLPVSVLPFML